MKNLLKTTFQQKYSRENFEVFLAKAFQKSAMDFEFKKVFLENDGEKYSDTRCLLSFETDDKKTIEVLSIELKTKSNIEVARSYQRSLIEKYIKRRIDQNRWIDGVLVSFWNGEEKTWRLSFVTMDLKDGKKVFTPPKRSSFLVGEGESTHTAEKQFYDVLKNGKTPLYSQLLDGFSVEKVTDEFFEEYKKHFLALNKKFLENEIFQREVIEKQGVKNADFVKKLMGQIVFLYFLQKKGWLGVERDNKWGSGDKNFMRNLLNECLNGGDPNKERGGKNFFNDYLEHLFYNTLNNKHRERVSVSGDYSWAEYFNCKIPYLNGGLFEAIYDWETTYIDIPNSVFEDLFTTFDRYNFTVYESDNLETDVAVDPEMLGKVFENLLEINERKGKGAFYTPREIVHYMCQESLTNYLTNASGYPEERIRKVMKRKDEVIAKDDTERKLFEENKELKDIAEKIYELLKIVTVCDPAVGSGAFPMGMMKEIVSLRFFLNRVFIKEVNKKTRKQLSEYDIKKETLENCIYGVDIEPGAIEICRLRFWLSMVVEHDIEEVEPLPNLDYKLMQGNSLLEDLVIGDSVIKLNIDNGNKGDKRTKAMKSLLEVETQRALFSMDSHTEVVDKLQKLHTEFFDQTDSEQKKKLKLKIDEYENLFIETACNDEIDRLGSVVKNSQDKKKQKAEEQIVLIQQTLEKWKKDHVRPFFPWKLHFGEIFKDKIVEKDWKAFHITWVTHNSRVSERMVKYKVKTGEAKILSPKEREIISIALNKKIEKEKYRILEFNVLDDHVHCVLVCEESKLSDIVRSLKGYSSFYLSRNRGLKPTVESTLLQHTASAVCKTTVEQGRQNKVWAKGFSNTYLETDKHFHNAIEYVQNNHLKHNLPSLNCGLQPFVKTKIKNAFDPVIEEGGFDIVIGNPPYVQLQDKEKISAEMQKSYKLANFQSFAKTGDIYCLFYERGNQFLKNKGNLCFITSNKWMRAGYGEKMRKYFSENTTPKLLIDLGSGVFETATVDTNILLFTKYKTKIFNCRACDIKINLKKSDVRISEYVSENKVNLQKFTHEAWTILSPLEQKIKDKIEKVGTLLKDWDIKINRGVLTGFNEAFIIDGKKKDELIAKDPKSAEIIKPILRGKDIKRYSAEFVDKWLIATHNGYKKNIPINRGHVNRGLKPSVDRSIEKVEAINIENYPAVKEWLDSYWEKISKRGDKGKTPYNLRNCAYQEEFAKEKIVYPETTQDANFIFDNERFFADKTNFIITGKSLKYLVTILSSKVVKYFYKKHCGGVILGEKGYQYNKHAVEKIFIPQISVEKQKPFIKIVDEILEIKKDNPKANTEKLEAKIDEMVFDLYDLTKEEREVVLNS